MARSLGFTEAGGTLPQSCPGHPGTIRAHGSQVVCFETQLP